MLPLLFCQTQAYPCSEWQAKSYKNLLYNATKGVVETTELMCTVNLCSRKTRLWPLCVMDGILNAACINSYISCVNRDNRGMNIIETALRNVAGEGLHNAVGTSTAVNTFAIPPTAHL